MISRNNIQGKKGIGLRPILTMSWSIQYSLKLCHNAMNPYGQLWKMEVQRIELGLKAFNKTVPWQIHNFFWLWQFFSLALVKNVDIFAHRLYKTQLSWKVTQIYFFKKVLCLVIFPKSVFFTYFETFYGKRYSYCTLRRFYLN